MRERDSALDIGVGDDNTEHEYRKPFLDLPELTLLSRFDDHDYGSWLYWYFLTKRFDDDSIVRQVWEQSESMPIVDAVNAVTLGGFVGAFPEFAATNWNRAGFSGNAPYDIYQKDSLIYGAKQTNVQPAPNPEAENFVSFEGGGVARLSAQYVRYDFTNANARTVLFANGYTFELAEGVPEILQSGSSPPTLYAKRMTADALASGWAPEAREKRSSMEATCRRRSSTSSTSSSVVKAACVWPDLPDGHASTTGRRQREHPSALSLVLLRARRGVRPTTSWPHPHASFCLFASCAPQR
jgi:hypothetical protein